MSADGGAAEQQTPPAAQQTVRYIGHHFEKIRAEASYVFFYVIDESWSPRLAVAGIDTRFSGHFIYTSVPDFPAANPLKVTNRTKVLNWLKSQGAGEAIDPQRMEGRVNVKADLDRCKAAKVFGMGSSSAQRSALRAEAAGLSPSQPGEINDQQLNARQSVARALAAVPKLKGQYSTWREEAGELEDGRHYKKYYLVDYTGKETLLVNAEDTSRRDRRYAYRVVPEHGGHKLDNSRMVYALIQQYVDAVVPNAMPRELAGDAGGGADPEEEMEPPLFTPEPPFGRLLPLSTAVPDFPAVAPECIAHCPVADKHSTAFDFPPENSVALDMRDAFDDNRALLALTTARPKDDVVAKFKRWAQVLQAPICDVPQSGELLDDAEANVPWIGTEQVLAILQQIMQHPISVDLLEQSDICKPVAALRGHPMPQIAGSAVQIVSEWEDLAMHAYTRATHALSLQCARVMF